MKPSRPGRICGFFISLFGRCGKQKNDLPKKSRNVRSSLQNWTYKFLLCMPPFCYFIMATWALCHAAKLMSGRVCIWTQVSLTPKALIPIENTSSDHREQMEQILTSVSAWRRKIESLGVLWWDQGLWGNTGPSKYIQIHFVASLSPLLLEFQLPN